MLICSSDECGRVLSTEKIKHNSIANIFNKLNKYVQRSGRTSVPVREWFSMAQATMLKLKGSFSSIHHSWSKISKSKSKTCSGPIAHSMCNSFDNSFECFAALKPTMYRLCNSFFFHFAIRNSIQPCLLSIDRNRVTVGYRNVGRLIIQNNFWIKNKFFITIAAISFNCHFRTITSN